MDNTWTIVKFRKDNSIAVVPTIWIVKKDECLWPPFTSEKITTAIKTCQINSCWPTHKIDSLRNATFDSYDNAYKKLKVAEEKSYLNTEDEDVPFKRKRIQRRFSSSSEDDMALEVIKTPPKLCLAKSMKVNKMKVLKNLSTPNETALKTFALNSEENLAFGIDVGRENLPNNDLTCFTPKMTTAVGSKTMESMANKSCSNTAGTGCSCCPVHVQYFTEIVRQLSFITSLVKEVLAETKRNNLIEPLKAESVLKDFSIPLTETAHLMLFNEKLNDQEFFQKAVTEFSNIGGRNTYDFVSRCFKRMLSDKLAVHYSWLGRRTKENFQTLNISSLILSAAQKAGCSPSVKHTEESISQWLRRANDRLKSKTLKDV